MIWQCFVVRSLVKRSLHRLTGRSFPSEITGSISCIFQLTAQRIAGDAVRFFVLSGSVFCSWLAATATKSHAEDATAVPSVKPVYHYELWSGADAAARAWSAYAGATFALTGDIRDDGWRIRSSAGYGNYAYTSSRWTGAVNVPVKFKGTQSFADILGGYQITLGALTVKAFAGATQESHVLVPFDDENSVSGGRWGAKLALETWLNIGEWAFLQTDAAWSSNFDAHMTRLRAGYRLDPAWSVGLETGIVGNASYEAGRVGAFGRYQWSRGELSVSGGVSGDRSGDTGTYGTVGILFRF